MHRFRGELEFFSPDRDARGSRYIWLDPLVQVLFCLFKNMIGRFLDTSYLISGSFGREDQFIELQLKCRRISVLCCLDKKHHQKRNDGRACINNQLPRVAVAEIRTGDRPDDDDCRSKQKR